MRCKRCGSYAINPNHYNRIPDRDIDLCDVCYWRKCAEEFALLSLAVQYSDFHSIRCKRVNDNEWVDERRRLFNIVYHV
jgi:hypothetical protein